ncbi:hypothetical protein [Stakelama saccharophila]|uniref:Nutrient deprivation-induced protein n=1 Tax=Stakelama saccharophila TaxID=3075605 RepID=A0ABZ0BDP6_9SPHN|nr:hypothetical protein [Stakelama sp. W311]WNO55043.1 hypothetical protein RPR59_07310 [Stakelama sp. W311]
MADDKIPAAPVKDGPGDAKPPKAPKPPQPKATGPKPADPAKTAGEGSDMPRKSARDMVKEEASKASREAAGKARSYASEGKTKATGTLRDVSRMMEEAAGSVDERFGAEYGKYARQAAGSVSDFAATLESREVDELLDDVRDFVRKSPAVAIGTAAALGFVFARILKSGFDHDGAD